MDDDGTAPGNPLKQRLLEAALASLDDLTPTLLLSAIGTRAIARRAGGSPASINHHYGSLQGLADAVVAHVFDPRPDIGEGLAALIDRIRDSHLPLEAAFAMHGAEFDRLTTDPEFTARMGLWAFGGPAVTEAYRHYLRVIDDRLVAAGDQLFSAWQRTLRPPYDLAGYVATKVALVNGATLRHRVDPTPQRRGQFQRASVALDLILLRVQGDRHSTDDRLAEMNHYPRTAPASGSGETTTRARILHAASEVLGSVSLADASLTSIASRADVSSSTLHRHFATKQQLAAAVVRTTAAVALDPPADDLPATLAALVRFVRPRAGYLAPYVSDLLSRAVDRSQDPLLDAVHRAVAHANPGIDDASLEEASEIVTIMTIRAALAGTSERPEDVARRTLRAATRGVLGRG